MTDQLPGIGQIHKAIAEIMGEVGGVAKTRKNEQQGYKFRGIADITKACQPLLSKHGVHVTPHAVLHEEVSERHTKSGSTMLHIRQRIEFRFYHSDGSFFQCVTTGEAMDTGDKSSNKCMASALKYALTQTFCIPEEDPEADTENASPELGAKKEPVKTAPEPRVASPQTVPAPPKDGLTDAEIKNTVAPLAKSAGYETSGALAPLLQAIGGVDSLRSLERRYVPDLLSALEAKAKERRQIERDVDDVFAGTPANA